MVRSISFGIASAAVLLWLTFFAGPGAVEFATLAVAAVALWWFATVETTRLVDERNRPQLLLFGLATVACALLVSAAAIMASAITFLILGIGLGAMVTGFVRAIRHGMNAAPTEE